MISICIPVYNFDVSDLVNKLLSQLEGTSEIILIDDASKKEFKIINQSLQSSRVKLIELEKNIGRSRIRNLFLKYAENPYLIFLDCDAEIISDVFLINYRKALDKETQVVCGGSVYSDECPSTDQVLRWKYGTKKESKPIALRSLNPYSSFMTSNFLVARALFEKIRFDERITQYGHEDTLFGIEMEENNVSIKHINNPVMNGDVDSNEVFIEKTELALKSLLQITLFYPKIEQLEKHISLLRLANKIKRLKLTWLFTSFYSINKGIIKKRLLQSKNPSLNIFNLYKLTYYLSLKEKES